MPNTDAISEIAKRIAVEAGGFTGGPIERFGEVGRHTLKSLKRTGLRPDSYVLDVGCGVLRLGYWLVRFLEPDRYCAIEPNPKFVSIGLKHAVGADLAAEKRPRFDNNAEFDFSKFGVNFDFVVARSIFSHASPEMVCRAMESFRDNSSENAIMLASYKPLRKIDAGARIIDVKRKDGEWSWRRYGKAHLKHLAQERGLFAGNYGNPFNEQVWLRVSKQNLEAARRKA